MSRRTRVFLVPFIHHPAYNVVTRTARKNLIWALFFDGCTIFDLNLERAERPQDMSSAGVSWYIFERILLTAGEVQVMCVLVDIRRAPPSACDQALT